MAFAQEHELAVEQMLEREFFMPINKYALIITKPVEEQGGEMAIQSFLDDGAGRTILELESDRLDERYERELESISRYRYYGGPSDDNY